MSAAGSTRQNTRFIVLYALAWGGGAIAYSPFLAILLPSHISEIAPGEAIPWLAYISFTGAIAASLGAIAFGWLSDLTRSRTPWIVTGLIISNICLISVGPITQLSILLVVIVVWQLGLNMMLAPLAAWAGDCVPHHQKGTLGGFLALAPAIGALSSTIVTIPAVGGYEHQLIFVAVLVTLSILPVLLLGKPQPMPELMAHSRTVKREAREETEAKEGGGDSDTLLPPAEDPLSRGYRDVWVMWLARFLVQIGEAALFAFLLIWLRTFQPGFSQQSTAQIFSIVLVAAVPVAMYAGRWADRHGRPIWPLLVAALVSAAGLMTMALAQQVTGAVVGYFVFGVGGAVFLALHSAQTLRVLPRPEHRGRDLGMFNLTNTVPSLVMPWLTIHLVPRFGFSALLMVLSLCALGAALLLAGLIRRHFSR